MSHPARPALLLGIFVLLHGSAFAAPSPPPSRSGVELDSLERQVRDADGQLHTFETAPAVDPAEARVAPAQATPLVALPGEGPYSLAFDRIFELARWGTSIGRTGLIPKDLDGDGDLEIVLGASVGGFASNSSWRVVEYDSVSGEYRITSSTTVAEGVSRIAVLDLPGGRKILVGRGDGGVNVHSARDLSLERELAVASDAVTSILLADADNDGASELVIASSRGIHLLDPTSFLEESSIDAGAAEVAVGQVDGDPELEIVLVSGPVIQYDGLTPTVEWDYSLFTPGRYLGLTDLDGDGMEEIVSARSWYVIDVYDADLRSPKYQIDADLDIQALLLADVTGDGKEEILYGDGQWGNIYAHDAATGTELWRIRNPSHGTTRIAVADTDRDGSLEVMWGAGWTSTGSDHLYVHDVATGANEFKSDDVTGPFAALTMGDADDDGEDEIVAISWESRSGYDDGVVHVFDAETFELEWKSGTDLFGGYAWTGVHDVALGDVDGDGRTEIVVGTDRLYDGAIFEIDGRTHDVERSFLFDSGSPIYALTLADYDGDGRLDIVAGGGKEHTGSPGTFAYVIDGISGAVIWQSVGLLNSWSDVWAIDALDLDGDGKLEIVVSLDHLFVIDGATKAVRKSTLAGHRGMAVGDLDRDGVPEIWAGRAATYPSTAPGELYRYDVETLDGELVATVCQGPINSVAFDEASTLSGTIQFACNDDIGVYGLFEDGVLWRSDSLGGSVGWLDNLVVADRGDRAMLVAGSTLGVTAFAGWGTSNTDIDEDGVENHVDNCPEVPNPDQADRDGDGVGDLCNDAADTDGDEWADARDNCPETPNADQADTDLDWIGDACNDALDADGDEWADGLDNCVDVANGDQANRDGDELGDVCDPYPDNPDNYAARCEEAIENEAAYAEALGICEATPKFHDADGDGEADPTDACPGTAAATVVDSAGCSLAQFCDARSGAGFRKYVGCIGSDWGNDEPLRPLPGDCRAEKERYGSWWPFRVRCVPE